MKDLTLILFVAMVAIGLLPLIIALIGRGLASLLGCAPDGAELKPCAVFGINLGPMLTKMMMMHWLGIIGLPIAGLGALGLIIRGIVLLIIGTPS